MNQIKTEIQKLQLKFLKIMNKIVENFHKVLEKIKGKI